MAKCSAEELDEAAVWVARLRVPERPLNVEVGFNRWLTERPSHTAAYEAISEIWELTGALQKRPLPPPTHWERARFRAGRVRSAAIVASAVTFLLAGAVAYLHTRGIATNIGEERVLTLEDGSRVSLNTDTRILVKYTTHERRIELKSGEALFEVAKQPDRPFVVIAGNRCIKALGTAFDVREDGQGLSVTLLEGKVIVETEGASPAASQSLLPGQRLTWNPHHSTHVDLPSVDKLTAWRQGRVELEDASLEEAVREMNRYTAAQLVVEARETDAIRINGVFRAGDTAGFAAAVARSYRLTVERRPSGFVLRDSPE